MEEKAKKKKKYFLFYINLFLVFVVIGLVFYILADDGVIEVPSIDKIVKDTVNKKSTAKGRYEDISVENASVIELFNNVHNVLNASGIDQMVFNNTELKLEDMDENYKIGLAYNLFKNKGIYSDGEQSYTYEDVKNSYEKIFGPKTFSDEKRFSLNCGQYTLDDNKEYYVNPNASVCGASSDIHLVEHILSVKKYSSSLDITSGIVFYDSSEQKVYRDYNMKKKVSDVVLGNDDEVLKELTNYIQKNTDAVEQYTYSFKLGEDGFYYYTGVVRTQD